MDCRAITGDEEPCTGRVTANGRFPGPCNRQINVRSSNLISADIDGRTRFRQPRLGHSIVHPSIQGGPSPSIDRLIDRSILLFKERRDKLTIIRDRLTSVDMKINSS